jgi:hypothetical protein
MKTIIAGGRDYVATCATWCFLDDVHSTLGITEVVSGCARGADAAGERWAEMRSIPIRRFPADWDKHGKRAGPIRNRQMAEYADALIAFPGGRGTQDMLRQARERGLLVYEYKEPMW